MHKETKNWLATADYDLETARHMLSTGRYIYVVFMCHLSLEKTLKAAVAEIIERIPPKTHDLIYLLKLTKLSLSSRHIEFIGKLNNASIPTRYPEDIKKIIAEYPEEIVQEYLRNTEEIIKWIKRRLKSKE